MDEAPLALADYVCLAIIGERGTHGWAIVKLLQPGGEIGRVWSLSRPLTYRSIDRLVTLGLVARSDAGRRAELTITPQGRTIRRRWLDAPVAHLRDLRTEFLIKLCLRARLGSDPTRLIASQQRTLAPAIAALTGLDARDAVDVWRQQSALAAERFLEQIATTSASVGPRNSLPA